jgi:uncharacterized membrane protein YeaQ/YmgE (transglycosylase-associated protein family)
MHTNNQQGVVLNILVGIVGAMVRLAPLPVVARVPSIKTTSIWGLIVSF